MTLTDTLPGQVLLMGDNGTPYIPGSRMLSINEWSKLNRTHPRTTRTWLSKDEIPGATQDDTGKWLIPETAMRLSPEQRANRDKDLATLETHEVETEVVTIIEDDDDDEEFEAWLWKHDLRAYLDRMPVYIPVRIGARLLGLTIAHIKANPAKFGVLNGAGRNQSDVMPKLVIMQLAGLDRPVLVTRGPVD